MARGTIGILVAAAVVLVVVLFIFDSHLLSERCDHQVHVLTAEKQRAAKHIKELQQALAKSSEMLEKIRVGKAVASASSLHSQLNALTADEGGGVKPRRRARQPPPPSPNPPPPSPPRTAEQMSAAAPVPAAAGSSLLTPARIAVVVIAYNRPSYLDRALKSIYLHHPGGDSFPVFVSQDGENADVAAVVARHGARRIVHPRKAVKLKTGTYLAKFPGYAYLSLHYGWALGTLFADDAAYEGLIILEEDIEDDSLLCVSAFNDNGQEKYASDPEAIHRSDFFPGLGWLLTRRLWGELKDKWPDEKGFWDDWLREPPQRRGRASIRPEVSRTYTFGEKGTSQGQFSKLLRAIKLGTRPALRRDFDASPLLKAQYNAQFSRDLEAASPATLEQVLGGGLEGDVRIMYRSAKEYAAFCKKLGVMEDLKAGVPRTGYQGVVTLRLRSKAGTRPRVFLAPAYPLVDAFNGKIVE